MDGGDGVEHDAVGAAGKEPRHGNDTSGAQNILASDPLILNSDVITWSKRSQDLD